MHDKEIVDTIVYAALSDYTVRMYYTAFVHILQSLPIILSAESITWERIMMNYSVILTCKMNQICEMICHLSYMESSLDILFHK